MRHAVSMFEMSSRWKSLQLPELALAFKTGGRNDERVCEAEKEGIFHASSKTINKDRRTALTGRHLHSTAGAPPLRSIQLSSPPILRKVEMTDFKMLSTELQDLPAAYIHESGKAGASLDDLPNSVLVCAQTEAAISSAISLVNLLQATQSLLVVQISTIFQFDSRVRKYSQKQQHALMQLTHRLWLEAPASLPTTMTAHAAWKLGESIRRTIIASQLLAAVTRAINKGTVQH